MHCFLHTDALWKEYYVVQHSNIFAKLSKETEGEFHSYANESKASFTKEPSYIFWRHQTAQHVRLVHISAGRGETYCLIYMDNRKQKASRSSGGDMGLIGN